MSHNSSYIITTLKNNLLHQERKNDGSDRKARLYSQAINGAISLKNKCAPYTVTRTSEGDDNEEIKKFPFGRADDCNITQHG